MIKINWNEVDEYLQAGLNGIEISEMLGIHPDTLYLRCKVEQQTDFSDYKATKRAKGIGKLKIAQYQKALNGDTSMLIWLGKNDLNQSDKRNLQTSNLPTAINIVHTTIDEHGETLSTEIIENVNGTNSHI